MPFWLVWSAPEDQPHKCDIVAGSRDRYEDVADVDPGRVRPSGLVRQPVGGYPVDH